jgi:DNA modification methylase
VVDFYSGVDKAGWDEEILAIELQHLLEIDFDLDMTGFEAPVVDYLIETQLSGPGSDRADIVPETDSRWPVISRAGDIWILGPNRLMCGSALDAEVIQDLMDGKFAKVCVIDLPYNVHIDGNVCGSGAIKHDEFVMASGEMSQSEFRGFLERALRSAALFSADGAIHYLFMDWRSIDLLILAGREVFSELLNICIWNKTNAGMGSFYRSQHEMIAVFKNGTASHKNNIQLGRHGRNRSNVWTYPGVNSLDPKRRAELALHPTVKPVALVADAIRDSSKRGDIVLDTFVGSGTTIIAAAETGRIGYGLELDPKYVDVAVRRWEIYSGDEAIHAQTGLTFHELAKTRLGPMALLSAPDEVDQSEGVDDE